MFGTLNLESWKTHELEDETSAVVLKLPEVGESMDLDQKLLQLDVKDGQSELHHKERTNK